MDSNNLYSQQDFERIESYILGQMTEKDRLALESDMLNDQNLRNYYEDLKVILQEVELSSLKETMEEFHEELVSPVPIIPLSKKEFKWKPYAVAASVLCLLVVSLWIFTGNQSENEKLFVAYYRPDPGMVTAMGAGSNYEFDRGMVDYKTGDYQAAITRWEMLLKDSPENDTLNYFLGSAYLAIGDAIQAQPFLEKTIQNQSGIFQKEAYWYLGLSFIKSGKTDEAIEFLQQSEREEAAEIIGKLKK
jgi:tetratricopeptide (TPR) repeat protein